MWRGLAEPAEKLRSFLTCHWRAGIENGIFFFVATPYRQLICALGFVFGHHPVDDDLVAQDIVETEFHIAINAVTIGHYNKRMQLALESGPVERLLIFGRATPAAEYDRLLVLLLLGGGNGRK